MKFNAEQKESLIDSLGSLISTADLGSISLFKNGGEVLDKDKSGSKIHIKKANRGKFTEYCGGNVTSDCISKGKNSSNPAVRKRATFAANVRKWNH